jgi:hypothetical protein
MDIYAYTALESTEITEQNLLDAVVYNADDYEVGIVTQVDGAGPTAKVILDVGSFLEIGARNIVLSASDLGFVRDDSGIVHGETSYTKEQIAELPEY